MPAGFFASGFDHAAVYTEAAWMCTERIEYRKASELPSWHFFLADPLAHYGSEMGQLARSPVSTHRAAQWTEQSVRAAERSELSSESASWRKTLLNDSEIGRK